MTRGLLAIGVCCQNSGATWDGMDPKPCRRPLRQNIPLGPCSLMASQVQDKTGYCNAAVARFLFSQIESGRPTTSQDGIRAVRFLPAPPNEWSKWTWEYLQALLRREPPERGKLQFSVCHVAQIARHCNSVVCLDAEWSGNQHECLRFRLCDDTSG